LDAPVAPPRARPTLRGLLGLAWPIVLSRSAQVVVGIADAAMVAHLGEEALAATTTGAMNAFTLFILPMGTVFIVSSFSSQLLGSGDPAGARRYGWYGLLVAAATQALAVAVIPGADAVLALLPYAPGLRAEMQGYLDVRLWSAGSVVALEALANYYGGLGNTRRPMVAQVAAMALNVAGNWLLIDGNLGVPAMGVRGAALASTVSTALAALGLFATFAREGRGLAAARLRARELLRMLRFGLPAGLNWFFEFMAFIFFTNVVVAGLGTTALAALMAVVQIASFAFMPAFAVSSAGAILVGQAIGAGRRDDVPHHVRLTFLTAAGWQAACGVACLLFPRAIFGPFAKDPDPALAAALLDVGARMLAMSAAWQLFDATVTTLAESLRAAGDTAFTLHARLVVGWLVFVPGSWISVHVLGGGVIVAMLWLVLYLGILAAVLFLRFRGGAWRRIELVEPVA
jgi:MATE family multidrug resistance protein